MNRNPPHLTKEVKKKKEGNTETIPLDIFRALADMSDTGIAILHNFTCLYANEKLFSMLHLNKKDVLGQELSKFVHPADIPLAVAENKLNRKISYEIRVLRGDGVPVDIEVRGCPVKCTGKTCRLLMLRDITERKSTESGFRSYNNLINSLPQAIFVLSSVGTILFSNISGEKMAGLSAGEPVTGSSLLDYIMPEYHNSMQEFFSEMKIKGAASGRFVKFRSVEGKEPRSIEMWAVPVEWEHGRAAMAICHDMSLEEQIEKSEIAQQAIQSVNEHLKWEIEQHALLQERLKKMVEEKEWLLKEVNHRVKNNLQILTSILNLQINQMQDKNLIPVMREFQNRFYALSSIYSNLYHSGDSEEIDLSKYLHDLAQSLSISYAGPDNNIIIRCDAEKIIIDYNEAITFGLIVNELISNSIKYAFPGGRKGLIEVKLKKSGDKITLIVSDNGIGSKHAPKPDSQVSLGLQLVASLVTQLKNSEVKEQTGKKGTRFEITCTCSDKIAPATH